MSLRYEFKVVPAPRSGERARGAKSAEERFALALAGLLNQLGREGWDYLRADTLPVEERSRWGRRVSLSQQTVLVFRRALPEAPPLAAPPAAVAEATAPPPPEPRPRAEAETRREPQLARLPAGAAGPPAAAPTFEPPLRRPGSARQAEAASGD